MAENLGPVADSDSGEIHSACQTWHLPGTFNGTRLRGSVVTLATTFLQSGMKVQNNAEGQQLLHQ